jgi:hypothetical protein
MAAGLPAAFRISPQAKPRLPHHCPPPATPTATLARTQQVIGTAGRRKLPPIICVGPTTHPLAQPRRGLARDSSRSRARSHSTFIHLGLLGKQLLDANLQRDDLVAKRYDTAADFVIPIPALVDFLFYRSSACSDSSPLRRRKLGRGLQTHLDQH